MNICDVCNREAQKICSTCHVACYCSADCQAVAWRKHQKECKLLQTLPKDHANTDDLSHPDGSLVIDYHLPTELWRDIFKTLANPSGRKTLSKLDQVSKPFHEIVQDILPMTFREITLVEPCPPNNDYTRSTMSSYEARNIKRDPLTKELAQKFSLRPYVQSLTLHCPCENVPMCNFGSTNIPDVVQDILPSLVGLKHMKFSRTILGYTELEALSDLPSLTSLEVCDSTLPSRPAHSISMMPQFRLRISALTLSRFGYKPKSELGEFLSLVCTPALKSFTLIGSRDHDDSWITQTLNEHMSYATLEYLFLSHVCPNDDGSLRTLLEKQPSLRFFHCGGSVHDWSLPGSALPLLETMEGQNKMVEAVIARRPIRSASLLSPFLETDNHRSLIRTLTDLHLSSTPICILSIRPHVFDGELLDKLISMFPNLQSLAISAEKRITQEFLDEGFPARIVCLECLEHVSLSSHIRPFGGSGPTWQHAKLVSWGQLCRALSSACLNGTKWVRVGFWDWVEER